MNVVNRAGQLPHDDAAAAAAMVWAKVKFSHNMPWRLSGGGDWYRPVKATTSHL